MWKYGLESAGALNSKTGRRVYEGALVRSGAGFGCVHPWPELGDGSLEECLEDLKGERKMRLVKRTWACLEADGEAREVGRSLFEGLEVPRSHATLPVFDEGLLGEAVEKGFTHVKVKAGGDVKGELARVRGAMKEWPGLRWRIDFNESGSLEELLGEFAKWSDEEREAVDFLEDPLPYHGGDWARLRAESGMAVANDRWVEEDRGDSDFLVVKPAVNEMLRGEKVVVTSYLDHPLGQVFAAWEAAWEAARAGVKEVCGLQTHGVFERSEFTEVLGEVGPEFSVPEGTGLGFGEILDGLDWVKL